MNNKIKSILVAVEALASALDCGRQASEQVLNDFEKEIKTCSDTERNEIRRKTIFIVAQLSRLEVRLMTSEGPMHGSI